MSEGEAGIPLWLDIGVMHMATREPLPGALISLSNCNAKRSCSSVPGFDPTIPSEGLLDSLNLAVPKTVTILNETIGGDPNGNYTMGVTDIHPDDETWLRGVWPTKKEGLLKFKPTLPGYYAERTTRLHIQVYKDWALGAN